MALTNLYAQKSELSIDASSIAERTQDWVGAEIKGLMQKAQIFRLASKSDEDAVETAFSYVRPMCISDKDRFFKRIEDSKAQGVSVNIEEDSISNFEIPTAPEEITKTQSVPKSRRRTMEG
jgi:hypothetical protein